MRPIILTLTGAAMLIGSMLAVSAAMSPQQCDALAGWIYSQAEARDAGMNLKEHEAAVREVNASGGDDLVALLVRELRKVYAEGKTPIAAAMDSRFGCYSRKGEVGVEVHGAGSTRS